MTVTPNIQYPIGLKELLKLDYGKEALEVLNHIFQNDINQICIVTKEEQGDGGTIHTYLYTNGRPSRKGLESDHRVILHNWFDRVSALFLPTDVVFKDFDGCGDCSVSIELELNDDGRVYFDITSKFTDYHY
jgi:hypothetical protein